MMLSKSMPFANWIIIRVVLMVAAITISLYFSPTSHAGETGGIMTNVTTIQQECSGWVLPWSEKKECKFICYKNRLDDSGKWIIISKEECDPRDYDIDPKDYD